MDGSLTSLSFPFIVSSNYKALHRPSLTTYLTFQLFGLFVRGLRDWFISSNYTQAGQCINKCTPLLIKHGVFVLRASQMKVCVLEVLALNCR